VFSEETLLIANLLFKKYQNISLSLNKIFV